jgi:hypothetical protein
MSRPLPRAPPDHQLSTISSQPFRDGPGRLMGRLDPQQTPVVIGLGRRGGCFTLWLTPPRAAPPRRVGVTPRRKSDRGGPPVAPWRSFACPHSVVVLLVTARHGSRHGSKLIKPLQTPAREGFRSWLVTVSRLKTPEKPPSPRQLVLPKPDNGGSLAKLHHHFTIRVNPTKSEQPFAAALLPTLHFSKTPSLHSALPSSLVKASQG